jgi:putative flavoprotein involved in K+ transport
VTNYAGLYFVGLPWLHNAKSGLIFGVSADATHVASHIVKREQYQVPNSTTHAELEVAYEL